jgi:hypothetical protein
MNVIKVFSLLAAIALASSAFAAEGEADKLAAIVEQQRALAADLDAGKIDMTPRQANSVRKAQKEVFALTDGKASLDALSIDEKVRLENALERINAEVKGGGRVAGDEKQVCWRERISGSQMKSTRCGTEAERREAREGARDFMEKPKVCVPPGCGA